MKWTSFLLVIWTVLITPSLGANILFFLTVASHSHCSLHWTLAKALAERGHNVTFQTPLPRGEHWPRLTEVAPTGLIDAMAAMRTANTEFSTASWLQRQLVLLQLQKFFLTTCKGALPPDGVINQRPKFDMVIMDDLCADCGLIAAHAHDAISVYLSSPGYTTAMAYRTGNTNLLAVNPLPSMFFPTPMKFWNRLSNVVLNAVSYVNRYYIYFPQMQKIGEEALGRKMPPLEDLEREAAFAFVNQHVSVEYPRSYLPNVVEVGGLHCVDDPMALMSKELRQYLDESGDDGFIYMSFGTFLQYDAVEEDILEAFVSTFSKLPQRVLWKWNNGTIAGISDNVRVAKWFPQFDILGHPNIRLIITHGGLMTHQETIHRGVPQLTIPFWFDQITNAYHAERLGIGRTLKMKDVTSERLLHYINEIIHNKRFNETAKRVSQLSRDQPETPLERAVFWTEYLLRHNGAPHLRSPSRNIPFYQYYLLDIFLFIFLIVSVLIFLIYNILRFITNLIVYNNPIAKIKTN